MLAQITSKFTINYALIIFLMPIAHKLSLHNGNVHNQLTQTVTNAKMDIFLSYVRTYYNLTDLLILRIG